jgi:hypothetical protein
MNPKYFLHNFNRLISFWAAVHYYNRTPGKYRIAEKIRSKKPVTAKELQKLIN